MFIINIWIDKQEKQTESFATMWEVKERIEDLAESVSKKEISFFRGNITEKGNEIFQFEYAPVASISWW